jgi:putative flippase GtrA
MAEQYRHAGPAVKLRSFAGRTARYTLVGAICAVVNNILIIGGTFFCINYVVMSFVAFAFVTTFAYLMHTSFTFRERRSVRGLLRFSSGVATGFPLFILLMAIFCTGLGMPVAIATPLSTVVLYAWNYALAHWTIRYRDRHP